MFTAATLAFYCFQVETVVAFVDVVVVVVVFVKLFSPLVRVPLNLSCCLRG